MTERWRGIHKITEEAGELLQVLGKLGPFPSGNHPQGGDNLKFRLEEEIADLEAALLYFTQTNNLDARRIRQRCSAKLDTFHRWGLTGIDNGQG